MDQSCKFFIYVRAVTVRQGTNCSDPARLRSRRSDSGLMEGGDIQRSVSLRPNRRLGDRDELTSFNSKDGYEGLFPIGRLSNDHPMKIGWRMGFVRVVLVAGIIWMLLVVATSLFHVWSCQTSVAFFSAICKRNSQVNKILDTMGIVPAPHRCPIPLASDPDQVVIPKGRTPDDIIKNLSYVLEEKSMEGKTPVFGGHETWSEREKSFELNSTVEVHCGFIQNSGAEMEPMDVRFVKNCQFVVASGIFDGYDVPHQPSNISSRSKKLFCFLMVVDETSLYFIKSNVTVRKDAAGGQWVGIWRLILLRHSPYDEPRRNGKVPKILTHRLFPQAQYSIWIDGKMELIVDPLLMLERYLWRVKHTFSIAQHKHHKSIYEEADANKRRKRYARPLIDLHMKIYKYEGMEPWSSKKENPSDVPEGAIVIREHTALNNLFSCLWFNEVDLFSPRDQLSFGYVVHRLKGSFKLFMFPNCEYNSIFVLHPHTREHSSKIEWVKSLKELEGKGSIMKETRGGLGLWTPYPGNLDAVILPAVARTSKAG